jgi:hypothetical protein
MGNLILPKVITYYPMQSDYCHLTSAMKTITSTELARNLRQILDQLATEGGKVVITGHGRFVSDATRGCRSELGTG